MIRELKYNELTKKVLPAEVQSTEAKDSGIIGQSTASEAIRFGLKIKDKGYNIYVAGAKGCGKTTFALRYAKEQAATEPTPDDLCYVYNFKSPISPRLIKLNAGTAKEFKEDMAELINHLTVEMPKAFGASDYEEEKERINKAAQKQKDEVIKELTEQAKKFNFGVKMANGGGVYFLPIVDDKTISEEEFDTLSEDEKENITEGSEEVQELAAAAMRQIKQIDKQVKDAADEADYNLALMIVGRCMSPIQAKYIENSVVSDYLTQVKEDILDNIEDFSSIDDDGSEDPMGAIAPWLNHKGDNDWLDKYGVNVIVDNSEQNGAPVIINYNPTYTNLVGEVEYESENGNLTTDFMKIKPGLFHKANGGYLLFHAADILGNSFAWDTVQHMLKTGTVTIEPLKEYQLGGLTVAGIKPEPLELNIKVIIIGSMHYYELLREYDDNFSKLYKICAVFDYEMEHNECNVKAMAGFIKHYSAEKGYLPVTDNAVCALLDHSARLSERQDKLSTQFGTLMDILTEANEWAKLEKASELTDAHIIKAIAKRHDRLSLYADKYTAMIKQNEIFIDTDGYQVGQINGLCVMQTDEYTFGMPTRITASTYTGKAGVVNIEKEADLSGAVHDKGVNILTGYLGMKYAQSFPLTLSCRICFEQSYNGVDGDSASSTETYAIISSLSSVPINQAIAVTGSVNQFGQIQPIGGVIYKIEGFYEVCKHRGLNGNQGVMIPASNTKDLILSDEVVQAVKDGKFHIYAVDTIDDGLELLTGRKAGKALASGGYSKDSVHALAYNKLKTYYKRSKED